MALPKQAAEAMGSVDILVNNAGVTRDNLFMRMSDDEWTSVLDINLTSTMRLCKGVMRGMMKARWGRIINVSSIVGATGNPGQANYAASKAGVVAMSKSLAYEVATRGITWAVLAKLRPRLFIWQVRKPAIRRGLRYMSTAAWPCFRGFLPIWNCR